MFGPTHVGTSHVYFHIYMVLYLIIIDYDIISYHIYFCKKSPRFPRRQPSSIQPTHCVGISPLVFWCLRMIRKSHAENRLESSDLGWSWLRVGNFDRKMGRDGKVKVTTID